MAKLHRHEIPVSKKVLKELRWTKNKITLKISDEFFSALPVVLDRIKFFNRDKFMEFEYEGATVKEDYITFHLGDKRIINT